MAARKGLSIGVMQSVNEDNSDMLHDGQGSSQNIANSMFEGLEDLSLCDGEDMGTQNEDMVVNEEELGVDIGDINFQTFTPSEVKLLEFSDAEAAYDFYNEYGFANGFSIRRNKIVRNKKNEVVGYSFVCSREGYRHRKYLEMENRRRDHRPLTRCGCQAEMRVRVNVDTGRWFVLSINDDHNHELVGEKYSGLLRSHRRMLDADIAQMNSMRESGISIPKIYGSFAMQSGGHRNVGFKKRDIYNQVVKQRKLQHGDANAALKYLRELASTDSMMYWRHEVDESGQLVQLFWCDGTSQLDYQLFGDVLAFDATYGRNKYHCPLIVFSGVNHHNQTCVFGSAIVSNETEETYVWVLDKFLEAMKGKTPKSVITDGDYAMRNAIASVFPQAHHRLCAWHLIRNATTNVGKPRFTQLFKRCMLGDYEVDEFEAKWRRMIEECDVEENEWVQDLYEKKMMWATAYIRGSFFAGLRTTSRCEALHAQLGKYVESRHNLYEFLKHFQRCLEYFRNNEVEADFRSFYGEPVMQTPLQALEKAGSLVYTRELFHVYRSMLLRSALVKVVDCRKTAASFIYIVQRYCRPSLSWNVSFYPREMEMRCSCQRMESLGIPCTHIIAVMVYIDMEELPKSLVLGRWTKIAKEAVERQNPQAVFGAGMSLYMTRYGALLHSCREMCNLACRCDEDYNDIREKVSKETAQLKTKHRPNVHAPNDGRDCVEGHVRDPVVVRMKGSRTTTSSVRRTTKRIGRCSICRVEGHNRASCPYLSVLRNAMNSGDGAGTSNAPDVNHPNDLAYNEMDNYMPIEDASIDMISQQNDYAGHDVGTRRLQNFTVP